jgi:hypothetical protein
LHEARPAWRNAKAVPIAREEEKQRWLSILSVTRQTVLRTFISWDNKKLGKEGRSGWDTRNLTTMAAGLMISKPLCLQIYTSCNFISRETRIAETSQTAGGHAGCSRVNKKQRGKLENLGLSAGYVDMLKNTIRVTPVINGSNFKNTS